MTDLNTQMTPEARTRAVIERLTARAEKAERELSELRAKTNELIAAAYEYIRANILAPKEIYTRDAIRSAPVHALVSNLASVAGTRLVHQIEDEIHASTPSAAKAALEARDRATWNRAIRQAAEAAVSTRDDDNNLDEAITRYAILSLIEKEPEGKGDE